MNIEELKKKLATEEEMLKKLEITIYQTMGRINILKDIINQENKANESK